MPHKTLDADKVMITIEKLEKRVVERFPNSGLAKVAAELVDISRQCAEETARLNQPMRPIRFFVYAIWLVGAVVLIWLAFGLHYDGLRWEAASLVQVLDPAMNIAVLVGIGVLALGRLELNWKRARALDYLHELRSLAHVVDMHQLTKDPYRRTLPKTASSPSDNLNGALLERYLDYCTEMLSLTGKLAALFSQSCRDPEVSAGASDVEQLATALSRKIWQKIMAFNRLEEASVNAAAGVGSRAETAA